MYEYKAIVKKVYDGDTITVDIDAGFDIWVRNVSIRLNHIDSPELKSKNELEAKAGKKVQEILSKILLDKSIIIKTSKDKNDKFGRLLGEISHLGFDINAHLINQGLVKRYEGDKKTLWTNEELIKIIDYK